MRKWQKDLLALKPCTSAKQYILSAKTMRACWDDAPFSWAAWLKSSIPRPEMARRLEKLGPQMVETSRLEQLPQEQVDEALLQNVKRYGILTPLEVGIAGCLRRGHRLLACARKLGIKRVPVIVRVRCGGNG